MPTKKKADKAKAEPEVVHAPVATATATPTATPQAGRAATPAPPATWTKGFSRWTLATLILVILLAFHLVGLWAFTSGFLLTRLTIPDVSPTPASPPIAATHRKAVILVIDALRTDFITHDTPNPSAHHHGVLTLPSELSRRRPDHSLIFNTFSDPPTSSMQRLKAITTGSLPTFIDAGANFASTAIHEDSIIAQLVAANKTIAFMGDDTWTGLYPSSFTYSHPYDSFNVEDLHSVDNGVIEHLFPYLADQQWDVLIGHFLGVDHVGHRVGPNRDTMRDKLAQMDGVLRRVVDQLDDETLLVVLGDHGMDDKGNHGGDSELETAAGLWMYSKGAPLVVRQDANLPRYTFPGMSSSVRHINQIDLVPTFCLLLGIPIPYNNLGSVIPELFSGADAMRINAEQIHRYLATYDDATIIDALAPAWSAVDGSYESYRAYTDKALAQLRSLWAQFSVPYMVAGLTVLGLNLLFIIMLYTGVRNRSADWPAAVGSIIEACVLIGGSTFVVLALVLAPFKQPGTIVSVSLIGATIAAQGILVSSFLATARPSLQLDIRRWIGPAIVFAHAISFASNSFIMWEDRMSVYLVNTVMATYLLKAVTHPTDYMRLKVVGLSVAFGAISRILGMFTVCREEQQPYCTVTFYDGSQPVAPKWVLFAVIPLALHLPRAVAYFFHRTKSLAGPARTFLEWTWRGALVLNASDWLLEGLFALGVFQPEREDFVRVLRTIIACSSFVITLVVLPYTLFTSALCISVERGTEQDGTEKPVTVFGFANAFGTTYLLFFLSAFAIAHATSFPTAQVALAGLLIALLIHLENLDTQRDSTIMRLSFSASSAPGAFDGATNTLVRPNFTDVVPLVLLGFIGFFSTGHQAVLSTIQWKSAFVGFSSVTWPFSPLLVITNTWSPLVLSAFAVPLLALWNVSPRPSSTIPVLAHTLQMALAFMAYHTAVTLASAVCAAWLRRHLMVWKVFAPRFMMAGVTLVLVDVGLVLAVGVALRVTAWKVYRTFRCESV